LRSGSSHHQSLRSSLCCRRCCSWCSSHVWLGCLSLCLSLCRSSPAWPQLQIPLPSPTLHPASLILLLCSHTHILSHLPTDLPTLTSFNLTHPSKFILDLWSLQYICASRRPCHALLFSSIYMHATHKSIHHFRLTYLIAESDPSFPPPILVITLPESLNGSTC
jgi:hypothetical protein